MHFSVPSTVLWTSHQLFSLILTPLSQSLYYFHNFTGKKLSWRRWSDMCQVLWSKGGMPVHLILQSMSLTAYCLWCIYGLSIIKTTLLLSHVFDWIWIVTKEKNYNFSVQLLEGGPTISYSNLFILHKTDSTKMTSTMVIDEPKWVGIRCLIPLL